MASNAVRGASLIRASSASRVPRNGVEIGEHQIGHGLAGLVRGARHVRRDDDVGHREEGLRHARFVGEDVECGAGDTPCLQGVEECGLVHEGATRHIDEDAIRTQRVQHLGADDVARFRRGRRGHDQDVAPGGEFRWGGEARVGHVERGPVAVCDLGVEAFQPPGDGPANAPETQDAVAAARNLGAQRQVSGKPRAFAHIGVAPRDLATSSVSTSGVFETRTPRRLASCRAVSAVQTPWRPMVYRRDRPPRRYWRT